MFWVEVLPLEMNLHRAYNQLPMVLEVLATIALSGNTLQFAQHGIDIICQHEDFTNM